MVKLAAILLFQMELALAASPITYYIDL